MQPWGEAGAIDDPQNGLAERAKASGTRSNPALANGIPDAPSRAAIMSSYACTPVLGSVLFVEDEQSLRLAASKMLQCRGWQVVEAPNGAVAVEMIRCHQIDISVILLDMTLPGTSSRTVLEEAQLYRPFTKIIVTSAFDLGRVDAAFAGLHKDGFIRKPYRLQQLTGVLSRVLGGAPRVFHPGLPLY